MYISVRQEKKVIMKQEISAATEQHLVARATKRPYFVHSCNGDSNIPTTYNRVAQIPGARSPRLLNFEL
jgi:hypothetical protein